MRNGPPGDRGGDRVGELIAPYGGRLVDLRISDPERQEVIEIAKRVPSVRLTSRAACDLELLATGAFSPLDRFMGEADYRRVCADMRLANGMVFPIPITLTVPDSDGLKIGQAVALRDANHDLLALLTIDEMFGWDRDAEARAVYRTADLRHPLVAEMATWGPVCISGPLKLIALPRHLEFPDLRLTPTDARRALERLGFADVVAFNTRNPLHRAHEELTKRAAAQVNGSLLLHPIVGVTKPGDVDPYTRVRTYRTLVRKYYDPARTLLSVLPLAMRMAGPREAVWHAIIRRNFGANHLIVGRDHAGPGQGSSGRPFYGPLESQQLVAQFSSEIGVRPIAFQELVYWLERDCYEERDRVPAGAETVSMCGTHVREDYLAKGRPLPAWFTRPETAAALARISPPRHRQGFCVWFTGLSGAGKSTIAQVLVVRLFERGRRVTVLDGDIVRTHLSSGLGFSRADQDTNIRRIGFVASEAVRHHGAVVCAAVSASASTRQDVRNLIGPERFILVWVNTPLDVCKQRDVKGLYARAREGVIKDMIGIDDPYEPPRDAELVLSTTGTSAEACADEVMAHLESLGFVSGDDQMAGEPEAP